MGLYLRGAERDECWEETPLEGVFEFELGFEVRSVSIIGGLGDLEGLEWRDIADGDREEGNEERDVRRFDRTLMFPLELWEAMVSVVVVRCGIAGLVALVVFRL